MPGWRFWTGLLAAGVVAYLLRRILMPFVVAALLAYVATPVVDGLERRLRLPRLAVLLALSLLAAGVVGVAAYRFGPTMAADIDAAVANAPNYVHGVAASLLGSGPVRVLGRTVDADFVARRITEALERFSSDPRTMVTAGTAAIEALLTITLSVILLFYFLLDGRQFVDWLVSRAPETRREGWRCFTVRVDAVLGRFLRGLIVIVLFTAFVAWVFLEFVFGLPYAPLFGLVIGSLELIPVVGPVVAAAVTSVAAFSFGGIGLFLKTILFYAVLRLVIDQVMGPLVLGKAVVLHPVVIIFAFLAGGVLFGMLGILIAIPAAAVLKVIIDHPPD